MRMAKQPECPECGSTDVETIDTEPKDINLASGFIYGTAYCEAGHEYGLELEIATILS